MCIGFDCVAPEVFLRDCAKRNGGNGSLQDSWVDLGSRYAPLRFARDHGADECVHPYTNLTCRCRGALHFQPLVDLLGPA